MARGAVLRPTTPCQPKGPTMATPDAALQQILELDGALAIALVDLGSGMALAQQSKVPFDLELAAAVNTEVIRSKMRAIESLGLGETIEDILITLGSQYHLIRLSARPDLAGVFSYLVLDRGRSNLALARRALKGLEDQLDI
jgi:predicted regulator of Ras-like GTPase activity (Roadblock/LC7/MglB family)